jgi:hypothetical protein
VVALSLSLNGKLNTLGRSMAGEFGAEEGGKWNKFGYWRGKALLSARTVPSASLFENAVSFCIISLTKKKSSTCVSRNFE